MGNDGRQNDGDGERRQRPANGIEHHLVMRHGRPTVVLEIVVDGDAMLMEVDPQQYSRIVRTSMGWAERAAHSTDLFHDYVDRGVERATAWDWATRALEPLPMSPHGVRAIRLASSQSIDEQLDQADVGPAQIGDIDNLGA